MKQHSICDCRWDVNTFPIRHSTKSYQLCNYWSQFLETGFMYIWMCMWLTFGIPLTWWTRSITVLAAGHLATTVPWGPQWRNSMIDRFVFWIDDTAVNTGYVRSVVTAVFTDGLRDHMGNTGETANLLVTKTYLPVIWTPSPRWWPFVRGIHRWIPSQGPVTRSFNTSSRTNNIVVGDLCSYRLGHDVSSRLYLEI